MTAIQSSAMVGWSAIAVMAGSYLIGSAGRRPRLSGLVCLAAAVVALVTVVVRFAAAF